MEGGCTPAKLLWSEVTVIWDVLFRRKYGSPEEITAPMRWALIGRQPCARNFNSDERMLDGGGCVAGGRTSAKLLWSEVIIILGCFPPVGRLLSGGNHSSDGASFHRKTTMRRLAQLRRANAGRRRVRSGRLNSCEDAVVGGNRHFGSSPPAEVWVTGGGRQHR